MEEAKKAGGHESCRQIPEPLELFPDHMVT